MKLSTRVIVMSGILAAMAITLKFLSFTTLEYRFTFYDIPLMISGIVFGPFIGGIVGFITDWIYATTQGWPIGLFTLSSIMGGLIPGLAFMIFKNVNIKTITVTVLVTSILCFSMNTFALYQFQGAGVLGMLVPRIITMVIKWPIEVIMLNEVYKRVIVQFNIKRA
ncbi:folate family ECF transporter S component [Mycoplasmatota bacterium WC44]